MTREEVVTLLSRINDGSVRLTSLWKRPSCVGPAYYRADNGYWLAVYIRGGFPRNLEEVVAPNGERAMGDSGSEIDLDPLGDETVSDDADIYHLAESVWGVDGMWLGGSAVPCDEHPAGAPWAET